jgi:hypothetical protein
MQDFYRFFTWQTMKHLKFLKIHELFVCLELLSRTKDCNAVDDRKGKCSV